MFVKNKYYINHCWFGLCLMLKFKLFITRNPLEIIDFFVKVIFCLKERITFPIIWSTQYNLIGLMAVWKAYIIYQSLNALYIWEFFNVNNTNYIYLSNKIRTKIFNCLSMKWFILSNAFHAREHRNTITSIGLIDAWNAHIIYTFEKKKRITIF